MALWDDMGNNTYGLPKTTIAPAKDLIPKPGLTGFLNSGWSGTKIGTNTPGNSAIGTYPWTRTTNPYDPQGMTGLGTRPLLNPGSSTGINEATGTGTTTPGLPGIGTQPWLAPDWSTPDGRRKWAQDVMKT
ncbi:MAG: hypothetical protein HQK89_08120 [Nitrospirae bacterium]|nr:hypothetical protein [Nitrospirota bacterium]